MIRIATVMLLSIISAAPALAANDAPSLPDPIMTPGAVDLSATVEVVCNRTTKERRSVSSETKAAVLTAYNIPISQSASYEIDHLVPLAIGGANTVSNLWPQPWVEADQKDVLEVELQRQVCHGLVSQAQAQSDIADDWIAAYKHYVLGMKRQPPLVAEVPPTLRQRVTERLKRGALRLYRSWIAGSD